jgi:multidrug efflux pump subunit AcrA (membrane-fusion protein)
VFATVQSVRTVPARVRTGGTIVSLSVREGDQVEKGQVVAVVADQKLGMQIATLDAQIAALKAELTKAEADQARNETLFAAGATSKTQMEALRTTAAVAGFNQSLALTLFHHGVISRHE